MCIHGLSLRTSSSVKIKFKYIKKSLIVMLTVRQCSINVYIFISFIQNKYCINKLLGNLRSWQTTQCTYLGHLRRCQQLFLGIEDNF